MSDNKSILRKDHLTRRLLNTSGVTIVTAEGAM
jgi:hypothetical protein